MTTQKEAGVEDIVTTQKKRGRPPKEGGPKPTKARSRDYRAKKKSNADVGRVYQKWERCVLGLLVGSVLTQNKKILDEAEGCIKTIPGLMDDVALGLQDIINKGQDMPEILLHGSHVEVAREAMKWLNSVASPKI